MRRKLYLAVLSTLSSASYALPQGGSVVAGDAHIDIVGSQMDIHQDSQRVVLEYESFNVSEGGQVNFIQPGVDAVALNRVVGDNLSEIYGQINANGQVFLINPNGVLFGQGAQVDVGGLVTTSLDIHDDDFMAGRDQFNGAGEGTVENWGYIRADQRAMLIAPTVNNSGTINAANGDVVLHSSRSVLIQPPGSEIALLVDDHELVGRIDNSGDIRAERVALVMDGRTQQDLYSSVINNTGVVRAVTATGEGGDIELMASNADAINTGTLDASADNGHGGYVAIHAKRYAQTGAISVAGVDQGDGGSTDILTSDTIVLHPGAHIDADAGDYGNGGEVILLSQRDTWYRTDANISARGGAVKGDGGFVEVSGLDFIDVQGLVSVGANDGAAGLWYIDPTNIEITNSTNHGGGFQGSDPFEWDFGDPLPTDAQINVATIRNTLQNHGDVLIRTESSAIGVPGNISFAATLDLEDVPSGRTLTLVATQDIHFQGTNHLSISGGGGLNFVLEAGRDIKFNSSSLIDVGSGTFLAEAGQDVIVNGTISSSNEFDTAISLNADRRIWSEDPLAASLMAQSGGILLEASTGIDLEGVIETSVLGLRNTLTGDVNVSVPGDLTLTSIGLGSDMDFTVEAGGSLTYSGSAGGDLNGAENSTINLSAGTTMAINGDIVDNSESDTSQVDIQLTAGDGFSMAEGVSLTSGTGRIHISTALGNAQVAGLQSANMADDAIRIEVPEGTLSGANVNTADITALNGGVELSALNGIDSLRTQVARIRAVSNDGNITLIEEDTFEVRELSAADLIDVTLGGDFDLANNFDVLTANSVTVTAEGIITVPDAGLAVTDTLSLSGADFRTESNGRDLALTATTLNLVTAASGGDLLINTTTDFLSITNSGNNAITVTDFDALSLLDASLTEGAITINSGAGGALSLVNDIDLAGVNGALTLNSGADLLVDSDLRDMSGASDHNTALSLTAANDVIFGGSARVDAGTGNLGIHAPGGSVALAEAVAAEEINITAAGNITRSNDSVSNLLASSASLGAGGAIGSSEAPIMASLESVTFVSGGDTYLINDQALSVTEIEVGGDLNLYLPTAGDLTIAQSEPDLAGVARFEIGAGQLVMPEPGLFLTGDLFLSALGVADGEGRLAAQHAELHFADGGADTSLDVDFDTLVLRVDGHQTVDITDSGALTVENASTAGDLRLAADADLDVSTADFSVGGLLTLATTGNGDLVLADTGLSHAGDLVIDAENLNSAASDSEFTLAANHADITLRDGALDQTWNTTFAELAANIAGDGQLTVINSEGLVLNGINTGGSASFTASGADLDVSTADFSVGGLLRLATTGNGDLVLADTGLRHAGDLVIDAENLRNGTGSEFALAAEHADITLRDGALDQTWNTTFAELAANIAGDGQLTVINSEGLVLNGINTGGSASFTASGADLDVSTADFAVGGLLTLATTGNGDLVLADTGLSHAGDLVIDAEKLNSAASDSEFILAAESANITLRDGALDQTWDTTFAELAANVAGDARLTVINSRSLALNDISTAGEAHFRAAGDLTMLDGAPSVVGDLYLTALNGGSLIAPSTGFITEAGLFLDAAAIVNNLGGASTDWQADYLSIHVRDSALDTTFNTEVSSLDLTYSGDGSVSVLNSGDLLLNHLDVAHAPTVGLSASGMLTVPDVGIVAPGRLNIEALDLVTSDRTVALQASDLLMRLSDAQGDSTFNLAVGGLDVTFHGQADLFIHAADGLVLADLDGDGMAASVADGGFALHLDSGDLYIEGDVRARDQSDNSDLGGIVDIAVAAGDLTVGAENDVRITSDRPFNPRADNADYGIRLRLTDTSASDRRIVLGNGSHQVNLTAMGSDVLLDARPSAMTESAARSVIQHNRAEVHAYNEVNDSLTGTVLINGEQQNAGVGQFIRAGRQLTIVTDLSRENILDELDDPGKRPDAGGGGQSSGPDAAAQFALVFGQCNDMDRADSQRCRIDAALKSFLSHWLVGGELPSKTEIH